MDSALAAAIGMSSPAGRRARLSILIFHRVLAEPDPLFPEEPDANRFDAMLHWVRALFNVLSLEDATQRLTAGTLPARAAAITFDDGYADNFAVAMPILRRHGLTATFFISTGYLDGGRMWNDTIIDALRRCTSSVLDLNDLALGRLDLATLQTRRAAIDALLRALKYRPLGERIAVSERIARTASVVPRADLMMTMSQVRGLREGGMEIGAHTVSHPILAKLSLTDARNEVTESRQQLESGLQQPVRMFAYPNGKPGTDYRREHADLARELGFLGAVSTGWGAASGTTDAMQLPRFTPWDRTRGRFGLRLLRNLWRAPLAA